MVALLRLDPLHMRCHLRPGAWSSARGSLVSIFLSPIPPSLQVVYPPHARLTEKEKSNICYLAFPDSNSGCMGDTVYSVRLRRCSSTFLNDAHKEYSRTAPVIVQVCA